MKDKIKDLQVQLAAALEHYRENADKLPGSKLSETTATVQRLQAAISDEITAGASKCRGCGNKPHGMQHPKARGAFEFEIGCTVCKPFEHTDGTFRDPRVRGGMMPQHAVEAWNAGPDYWLVTKPGATMTVDAASGNPIPGSDEPAQ